MGLKFFVLSPASPIPCQKTYSSHIGSFYVGLRNVSEGGAATSSTTVDIRLTSSTTVDIRLTKANPRPTMDARAAVADLFEHFQVFGA